MVDAGWKFIILFVSSIVIPYAGLLLNYSLRNQRNIERDDFVFGDFFIVSICHDVPLDKYLIRCFAVTLSFSITIHLTCFFLMNFRSTKIGVMYNSVGLLAQIH